MQHCNDIIINNKEIFLHANLETEKRQNVDVKRTIKERDNYINRIELQNDGTHKRKAGGVKMRRRTTGVNCSMY